MNTPLNPDLTVLMDAIASSVAHDQLQIELHERQRQQLADYLKPLDVGVGHVLIEQGATDRVVYFIESGTLSAHVQDDGGRMRLAVLNAGTVVGEGAFFSGRPRSATVVATAPSRVWCLTPQRFDELGTRQADLALRLTMAFGSVAVRRLAHTTRRIAVT